MARPPRLSYRTRRQLIDETFDPESPVAANRIRINATVPVNVRISGPDFPDLVWDQAAGPVVTAISQPKIRAKLVDLGTGGWRDRSNRWVAIGVGIRLVITKQVA